MVRRILIPLAALATTLPAQTPSVYESTIRTLTFPNGMRAVIARTPRDTSRAPRVFLGLYVRYGMPTAGRPELAHLVEHVVANNAPTLVNYQIPPGLTFFGSNAMTRPDFMSFWRTVEPAGVAALIPNRANRVVGVRDDSAIFVREVGRVGDESRRGAARIAASGPSIADVLTDAFVGARPSPEALIDTIASFDRATVFKQIESFIRPDAALLIVAGDVDPDSVEQLVRPHLAAYAKRSGPTPSLAPAFKPYRAPLVVRDARVKTTRAGVGLEAPARNSADYLAFLVLDQALMGGRDLPTDTAAIVRSLDTPFGRRLVSEVGATSIDDGRYYRTDPPPLALRSPSFLGAYVDVTRTMPADSVTAAMQRALSRALTTDLTDAEIGRAKNNLIRFMDRWMLGPDLLQLGDHLAAFTFIDGDAERLRRLPEEIRGLSNAAIRRLAQRYAAPGAARLAVVTGAP